MRTWLKRLFCRHEYDLKDATQIKPLSIREGENGTYIQQYAQVGVFCYCIKCFRENKRLSREFSKIKANQIKHQLNNEMREMAGRIYVRKLKGGLNVK